MEKHHIIQNRFGLLIQQLFNESSTKWYKARIKTESNDWHIHPWQQYANEIIATITKRIKEFYIYKRIKKDVYLWLTTSSLSTIFYDHLYTNLKGHL